MSIIQRVRELVELEKNKTIFANKVGIKLPSLLAMLKKDKGSLNYDTVMKILSAYPSINPMWFLMDEGDMYLSKKDSQELHEDSEDSRQMMQKVMIMMQKRIDQELDSNHKMIELLEKRVALLEYELKESNPNRAKILGIE